MRGQHAGYRQQWTGVNLEPAPLAAAAPASWTALIDGAPVSPVVVTDDPSGLQALEFPVLTGEVLDLSHVIPARMVANSLGSLTTYLRVTAWFGHQWGSTVDYRDAGNTSWVVVGEPTLLPATAVNPDAFGLVNMLQLQPGSGQVRPSVRLRLRFSPTASDTTFRVFGTRLTPGATIGTGLPLLAPGLSGCKAVDAMTRALPGGGVAFPYYNPFLPPS